MQSALSQVNEHEGEQPTQVNPFVIKPYSRAIFVGATGSGKSYFARGLHLQTPRLIVCDVTGHVNPGVGHEGWRCQGWKSGLKRLQDGKSARVYIEPQLSVDDWERYFWEIYKLKRVVLYIDELYGVSPQQNKGLKALFTRGRHLQIGVHSSVQRPASIPLEALSESEYKFLFRLRLKDDVDRMAYLMGEQARMKLPKYWGLFYTDELDNAIVFKPLIVHERILQKEGVSANV
jgi:hypothetical protein